MTINTEDVAGLRGLQLVDRDGGKVGKIDEIYLDERSGKPEWLTVNTGLFGTSSSFVPLTGATRDGDSVRVPYDKSRIKDAPNVSADGQLSDEEESRLYGHYGIGDGADTGDSGRAEGRFGAAGGRSSDTGAIGQGDRAEDAGAVGHDVSGPTTDEAMTLSEEELRVGTARREAGRARLRKYVVTENVTETVPVQREELRVEREPITDANVGDALDGPEISEDEHEVVLHEETPVVQKEAVPKERVRLDVDTRTEEQTVSEDVRKERIDVEGDERRRGA